MIEELEIKMVRRLVEEVRQSRKHDFGDYALASFKRRVIAFSREYRLTNFDALVEAVTQSDDHFGAFLKSIVPQTTELFRDPSFWRLCRDTIIPRLAEKPNPEILILGCSTGDELYSLLLLLEQAEVLDRFKVTATEIDDRLLNQVRSGELTGSVIEFGRRNYQRVVPDSDLDLHLHQNGTNLTVSPSLLENVQFRTFTPSIESKITGCFDMILCRNLLIYFNHQLHEKTQNMMYEALHPGGLLATGTMESLIGSQHKNQFRLIEPAEKVYRRI